MKVLKVQIEPAGVGGRVWYATTLLAEGDGAVVCEAARALVEAGSDPATTWLEAYRGSMLCLRGLLGNFAFQTVRVDLRGKPVFVPYRPKKYAPSLTGGRECVSGTAVPPSPEEGK